MNPQLKAGKLIEELIAAVTVDQELKVKADIYDYHLYKQKIEEPRNVLDHGFVRLVDYMGNDLSIVRAARVSYAADWRTGENEKSDAKLISYLLRNRHSSPFESVLFTLEFKIPIFIARQWFRHRTWDDPTKLDGDNGLSYQKYWSYNEVSARYTELPEEFYVPKDEHITTQAKDNKQARTQEQHNMAPYFKTYMRKTAETAFAQYKEFLDMGCPRELARTILPLSTYTRYFGTVNLYNLLHFLSLRLHTHAQYEIRVYAEAILDIISGIVPVTIDAWNAMRLENPHG